MRAEALLLFLAQVLSARGTMLHALLCRALSCSAGLYNKVCTAGEQAFILGKGGWHSVPQQDSGLLHMLPDHTIQQSVYISGCLGSSLQNLLQVVFMQPGIHLKQCDLA